ncbi:MAG: hypothetical protein AAGF83_10510 [Cyanobacteria bacterium P01_G01_bin.67]
MESIYYDTWLKKCDRSFNVLKNAIGESCAAGIAIIYEKLTG